MQYLCRLASVEHPYGVTSCCGSLSAVSAREVQSHTDFLALLCRTEFPNGTSHILGD